MLIGKTSCITYILLMSMFIMTYQRTLSNQKSYKQMKPWDGSVSNSGNELRYRRAIGKPAKPGFFWVLGTSIFQQFNETKSAYQQIRNLINDQFTDERRDRKTTTTTQAPGTVGSTTQAPFRISRQEFSRIILRNLRGLARLYNLELDAAFKQSTITRAEFSKQLRQSLKQQLS